jgi:2'-5' RNA ligase
LEDSALIIPVVLPDSLERIRQQHDPGGRLLPPHISLVVPFAPGGLYHQMSERVNRLADQFPQFWMEVETIGWFAAQDLETVYLRIASHPVLDQLMQATHQAFAEYPPYAGKHEEIIPHVTLARVRPSHTSAVRERAERAVRRLGHPLRLYGSSIVWIYLEQTQLKTETYNLAPHFTATS